MAEKNYYEILGVTKDADEAAIKKAYRKLVRKYHPDVSKEPDAVERTAEINRAYETLSDKEKRAEYDEMLANPYGRNAGGNPFGQGGNPFGNGFDGGGFRYEYREGEPFGAGDFKIEQLYIKLDKKLILRAQNIEIPKQSAKDSSEAALLDLSKNIVWIDRLFDEILLERVKFLNSESMLFYKDDVFYLDSPFLAVSSNFKDTDDGVTANVYWLEFKDFNVSLSGVSKADLRRQIYDFNGTFSSHELNGNATVNLKKGELKYELSDINATSLRGFMDELGAKTGLDKEIKSWIYGYITADNYFVKSLRKGVSYLY